MAKEVRHDKSCKFRLYPNEEQRVLIAKTFGCCRWVYNWGLAMRKKAWEEEKKSIGWKGTSGYASCYEESTRYGMVEGSRFKGVD